jgi:hypothetical protein
VCFAKHTPNKHNLGQLGLKPRSGPLITFALFYCNNYTETERRRRLYLVKPKVTVQAPTGECSPPPLFSFSSLCSCFFFFLVLSCNGLLLGFLCLFPSRVFVIFSPPPFASLRSVFIVSESLRV